MRYFYWFVLLSSVVSVGAAKPSEKRARPPKWPQSVVDLFGGDARANLSGERPAYNSSANAPLARSIPTTENDPSPSASGSFAWAKLISSDVLVDEIKSYQAPLASAVQTPSEFKGRGFKEARRGFAMLAVSFGVIAEYDGDARWKSQAAAARDLFGRAGANCKVATDASFNEAKLRNEDLTALIRGEQIQAPANIESKPVWNNVSNRTPLMNRLETAQQERLAVWTATAADFNRNLEQVAHEAQIMAALAEIIQRDGYEFADDDTYRGYAQQMQHSAMEIQNAVQLKNFNQARNAVGEAAKACNNCHGDFRS